MDETLRALLEQYIDEEQRGLVCDLERLSGGDPAVLEALSRAVREYHETQALLGTPRGLRATQPVGIAPTAPTSRGAPSAGTRASILARGGRAGAGFLCLAAAFILVCGYVLARLLWAQSHFRPAVGISQDLALERTLTSRGETYGLDPGFRIARAFGEPVGSRRDLFAAIDRNGARRAEVTLERPQDENGAAASRNVLWVERPRFAPPQVDASLRLLAEDALVTEGVSAGARVVSIDSQPVQTIDELRSLAGARFGRTLRIDFERPSDVDGVDFTVVTVVEWLVHRTLFVVGVAFGAIGFAVLWLKPRSRSAWAFTFFCLAVSVLWLLRAIPHHYRLAVEQQVYLLAMCSFPVVTVALLGTFTPLRLSWVPLRRYLVVAGLVSAFLYFGSFIVSPSQASVGLLADQIAGAWLGVSLALLALGQVSGLWARIRRLSLEAGERERSRALRWATLLAFGPYLLLSYLAIGRGREHRIWLELSVLAFPLVIAYAIQRWNLLQINELLRESLVLGSFLVMLQLGYAAMSGLTVPLAERWYPASSTPVKAVLFGGGVVVLAPFHRRARKAVRRRFRGPSPEWTDIARTIDDHRSVSTSAQELASRFVETVAAELKSADVTLLTRDARTGVWSIAAGVRRGASSPDLDRCLPLLHFLTARKESAPIFRDDLMDDLRYRKVSAELLRGMDELSAVVVFPVVDEREASRDEDEAPDADGRPNVGALAVGGRVDRRNYSRDELRLAEHLCRRIGHDLQTASLARRLRRTGIAVRYPRFPPAIGDFTIERALGSGGMAVVFLGRWHGGQAAIKIPNLRVQGTPMLLERFLRERTVLRTLDHRNIVPVVKTGWAMGEPFLAMEYYPRGTLHDFLASRGKLGETEALVFADQIASGLEAAFAQGVIHRDLKPKNVFFSDDGVLKIGDFGLAHFDDATTITAEGETFGTAAYMSPEVLSGGRADWRSDQYALGVCLFEMLAGRRPFEASTFEALLHQHVHQPVPDLRGIRPELRASTLAVVTRMLAKSPDNRFVSYQELRAAMVTFEREASA